jgi:hypothetical protein
MYYLKREKKPLPHQQDQTPKTQYYIGGGEWAAPQLPQDPKNHRLLIRLWANRGLAECAVRESYPDAQICEALIEV